MRSAPNPNPLVQLLALAVFAVLALAAFAFGALLFVLVLGAGLLLAMVGILHGGRLRWQRRRHGPAATGGRVIDGEYRYRDGSQRPRP